MLSPVALASDREHNGRERVFEVILADGPLTLDEIALKTATSRTMAREHVEDLVASGLIVQARARASTGGRRARNWELNVESRSVLAAHVSSAGWALSVTDLRGEVISHCERARARGEDMALSVDTLIDAMISVDATRTTLPIIGAAVVSILQDALLLPEALLDIRTRLARAIRTPVWVEPARHVRASELVSQTWPGTSNVLVVHMDDPMSLSWVSDGQIQRGARGLLGSFLGIELLDQPDDASRNVSSPTSRQPTMVSRALRTPILLLDPELIIIEGADELDRERLLAAVQGAMLDADWSRRKMLRVEIAAPAARNSEASAAQLASRHLLSACGLSLLLKSPLKS